MAAVTWEMMLEPHPTARGSAKNTFTTFQDISPLDLPILPANTLVKGHKVELEAWGEFSNTATPTLQIGFIYGATAGAAGGVTLAATQAIATTTGATAWAWRARYVGLVTATGATGSIDGMGEAALGTSLTAETAPNPMPITAAARVVTIDTTAVKLLGVGAAWGASSASNTITVYGFTAKILNMGRAA